jgi:hypothetical protein
MNDQANGNDGAAKGTDTTPSPAGAAPAATAPADAAPAATHGGQRQAFAPAGVFATGVGGRRVLWPVAIGAASVVEAAHALLNQLGGFAQFLVLLVLFAIRGELGQLISAFKGLDAMSILPLVMGAADLILPILLLAAGILVWRQGRRAPGLLKAYAIITILLSVGLSILQAIHLPEGVAGIFGSGRARTYLTTSLITSSLWRTTTRMIYPVFLLIWFSRPNVQAETRLWR